MELPTKIFDKNKFVEKFDLLTDLSSSIKSFDKFVDNIDFDSVNKILW